MKLYAGNLSYELTAEDLRAALEAHGEVVSVNLITDRETGRRPSGASTPPYPRIWKRSF